MTLAERAPMTGGAINDLPDSAFAYIEAGGKKDDSGKTTPRSLRHFPIHDAAHVRNALARAPQSPFGKQAMPKILAAAKKFGITVGQKNSADDGGGECRSVPFEIRSTDGDGLTLEGYAAVFNSPTRISGWEGDFTETILPGAFKRALSERTPVLMFDHGKHPLLGSLPLGVITRAEEDDHGLHVMARLSDNWLIQPVRDAVRDGAVDGMSFRFSVDPAGEQWSDHGAKRALREFAAVPELGPVVFPAYRPTTASVRSMLGPRRIKRRQVRAVTGSDTAAVQALLAKVAAADAVMDLMCDAMCTVEDALDETLATLSTALGISNPDPMDDGEDTTGTSAPMPPRAIYLTGQLAARSGGGGDSTTTELSSREVSPDTQIRDRVLRMEGILK